MFAFPKLGTIFRTIADAIPATVRTGEGAGWGPGLARQGNCLAWLLLLCTALRSQRAPCHHRWRRREGGEHPAD